MMMDMEIQKENFKMMSRRLKLSNELSKLRISTTDGIPVIQDEVEQDHQVFNPFPIKLWKNF